MDAEAINKLLEAIRAGVGVVRFGDEHGIAFVPESYNLKDLRDALPPPNRAKQVVQALSVDSFAAYINRFGTEGSVVFAQETGAAYECVLDYHNIGSRGHCDHRIVYQCIPSPEREAWGKSDGEYFDQEGFARFIEANLVDIVSPDGAYMLELALGLQVRKDATFVSDLRLETGQVQLRYEENIRGTTKAGDLTVPVTFELAIPVFLDGPKYSVKARFRYRLERGALRIGYELIRFDQVVRQAVTDTTKAIMGKVTATSLVYKGGRR